MTLDDLMQGVDIGRLEGLRRKYRHGPDKNPNWIKFLDWWQYGQDAIEWADRIGLNQRKGLAVLDIGCGLGYFVRAAILCGHEAIGLDIYDPFYSQAQAILGLGDRIVCYPIVAGEHIPVGQFDVITMFGFGLPRQTKNGPSAVGWRPYAAMMREILRHLRPGGLWFASINTGRDWLFRRENWEVLAEEAGGLLDMGETVFQIRKGG